MSAYPHPLPTAVSRTVRDIVWFGVGCVYAFGIPYLGISVLHLQHDLYYLGYFAAVLLLISAYVEVEQVDVRAVLRPRWRWSVGLGALLQVHQLAPALGGEELGDSGERLLRVQRLRRWRPRGYAEAPLRWKVANFHLMSYGVLDAILKEHRAITSGGPLIVESPAEPAAETSSPPAENT